jgi:hypothetical protein
MRKASISIGSQVQKKLCVCEREAKINSLYEAHATYSFLLQWSSPCFLERSVASRDTAYLIGILAVETNTAEVELPKDLEGSMLIVLSLLLLYYD